jgi:hypothetical protein
LFICITHPIPLQTAKSSPVKISSAVAAATAKSSDDKSKQKSSLNSQEKLQYDRPIPGSTLRCLDDPNFPDINSPPSNLNAMTTSAASRGLAIEEEADKARDRFDRFWGGPNDQQ